MVLVGEQDRDGTLRVAHREQLGVPREVELSRDIVDVGAELGPGVPVTAGFGGSRVAVAVAAEVERPNPVSRADQTLGDWLPREAVESCGMAQEHRRALATPVVDHECGRNRAALEAGCDGVDAHGPT